MGLALFALVLSGALLIVAVYAREGVYLVCRRLKVHQARLMHLVVREHVQLNERLCRIRLARMDNGRLPAFSPGQYVTIHLSHLDGGPAVRRRYSLAAFAPRPREYELCVKREDGGLASEYLFTRIAVGDPLDVKRPDGRFRLKVQSHTPVILIAGGVGITPLRAMIHARHRQFCSGSTVLFYAARHKSDLIYDEEFAALTKTWNTFSYHPVLSRPQENWTGVRGRLSGESVLASLPRAAMAGACFYICASASVTVALKAQLMQSGIDEGCIRSELFGPMGGPLRTASPMVHVADGPAFVFNGYATLLQALEAQKVVIDSECRNGDCGRCSLRLLAGEVEWLLSPETAQPPGTILACCCAPKSDVTIATLA